MNEQLTALLQQFEGEPIQRFSEREGANPEQVQTALESLIPVAMRAFEKKGGSQDINGFVDVLDQDKDGSILDNVSSWMGTEGTANGVSILGSLFEGKEDRVSQYASRESGLNMATLSKLFAMAAPVIMSYLGRQKKQSNGDLADLLGSLNQGFQGNSSSSMQLIDRLLDQDGDGSVLDDLPALGNSLLKNLL